MAEIITLDEYKQYHKINSPSDDSRLTFIVNLVNDFITEYCSLSSAGQAVTERLCREKQKFFILEGCPDSITSVRLHGQDSDVEATNYFYDKTLGRIEINRAVVAMIAALSTERFYDAAITYSSPAINSNLKLAALELTRWYVKHDFVTSKRVGVQTVDFGEANGIPGHIKAVLDLNRQS